MSADHRNLDANFSAHRLRVDAASVRVGPGASPVRGSYRSTTGYPINSVAGQSARSLSDPKAGQGGNERWIASPPHLLEVIQRLNPDGGTGRSQYRYLFTAAVE